MSKVKLNIEDHGVIGDLRTCALVANDGTIDYLCWPELDSPSVFSALLDSDDAGLFSLAPDWQDVRRQQLYLPDTNILQTRWLGDEGVAEITDYMPICDEETKLPRLIRRVKMVRGKARFTMRCSPRHDYARAQTRAEVQHGCIDFHAEGQPSLRLAATVVITLEENCAPPVLPYRRVNMLNSNLAASMTPTLKHSQLNTASKRRSITGVAGAPAAPIRAAGARWSSVRRWR